MKTVYFVRHGSTEGNENRFYQHWDTPLTAKGRSQAQLVAERFTRIRFDVILASDMERANETAQAIAKNAERSVITEPLLREIYRPSSIRGKSMDDADVKKIRKFTDDNFSTATKHSDEENFRDLKERAEKAIEVILGRPESTVVVVTHGTFMNMLIAVMGLGERLSGDIFLAMNRFYYQSNTGITKCVHNNGWKLLNWNDDAHLG